MKVAYANAFYHAEAFTGRNVHVKQFIDNATARGHEVWTWPRDEYPGAKHLPWQRIARYSKLREMDLIYVRLDGTIENLTPCSYELEVKPRG